MKRSLAMKLAIFVTITCVGGPVFADPGEDLMQSIYKNNLQGVKAALQKGVNVNQTSDKVGFTPLMAASNKGNIAIMKLIIEKGAKIEDSSGYLGQTPLLCAAESGNLDAFKLLLDKGAKLRSTSTGGRNVLMFAALGGNPAMVKFIAEKGIDVNAKDKGGWTALMHAAESNRTEAVKELITLKADLNVKSTTAFSVSSKAYNASFYPGDTALTIARVTGRTQIEKLLEAAGARSYSEEIYKRDELYQKLGLYKVEMIAASKGDYKECVGILKEISAKDPKLLKEIESFEYNDGGWFVIRIEHGKKLPANSYKISLTDAKGKALGKRMYGFTQTAGGVNSVKKYREVLLLQSAEPVTPKTIGADRSPVSLTTMLFNTSKKTVRFYMDEK